MLVVDPLGFGQDLPPAILQGRFCAEQREALGRKGRVAVLAYARKEEIRLVAVLARGSTHMAHAVLHEYGFQMISCACPALDLRRFWTENVNNLVVEPGGEGDAY